MLKRLTIPLLITLLVVACQPNQAPEKLAIRSRTPVAGAANVPVDTVVTATFNVGIKLATLDDNLTLQQGETAVEGAVVYDPSTRTATFTPDAPLLNDTVYTATVGAAVESSQGVRLGSSSKWSFTTEGVATVPSVTSVTILGTDFSLLPGETETLAVEVVVVDGADDTVVWTSSDDSVATVDDDGTVTAVAVGGATITATSAFDDTKADSVAVTVVAAPAVTEVVIDQVAPVTTIGGSVTLSATVTAVGGADESVAWESGDEAIATVDEDGVVTGVSSGTVTITATSVFDGTVSGAVQVVVAAPLTFADDYPTATDPADVNDILSLLPPAPTQPGYGDITYELTSGALPPAFVVDDGATPMTYELTFNPVSGEIRGSTGWPGTFTGTVTATDELGQSATLDFSIVRSLYLEVYDSVGTAPQSVFEYGAASVTVVPGDRIRVSGVGNTLWLPPEFTDGFEFSLDYVAVLPSAGGVDVDEAFDVNTAQGTVSLGTALDTQSWVYNLVLDYSGPTGSAQASVTVGFIGENFSPIP